MTENQGAISGRIESDENDDVQGHGIGAGRGVVSGRGVQSGRFRPDEETMFGDDVEGHGISSNRIDGDDEDTEGRAYTSGR